MVTRAEAPLTAVGRGLVANPAAVAAVISALVAAGALYYTAVQSSATAAQVDLAEQSQFTARYTSAIDQLSNPKPDVRVGGIYALERLARDSHRDQPTIVEVLSTYIRDNVPAVGGPGCTTPAPPGSPGANAAAASSSDVRAAVTVLSRRDRTQDAGTRVDLTNVCVRDHSLLAGVDLTGVDLTRADLTETNLTQTLLTGANLTGANLTGTDLAPADLTDANLIWADLSGAYVTGANLTGANLTGANLTGAGLSGANLTGANLSWADLDDTYLGGANLTHADFAAAGLSSANFDGAHFAGAHLAHAVLIGADLTGADLTGADLTPEQLSTYGARIR